MSSGREMSVDESPGSCNTSPSRSTESQSPLYETTTSTGTASSGQSASPGMRVKLQDYRDTSPSDPSDDDDDEKVEKSRQSARECRARKKLRYQYLEGLVESRKESVEEIDSELKKIQDYIAGLQSQNKSPTSDIERASSNSPLKIASEVKDEEMIEVKKE